MINVKLLVLGIEQSVCHLWFISSHDVTEEDSQSTPPLQSLRQQLGWRRLNILFSAQSRFLCSENNFPTNFDRVFWHKMTSGLHQKANAKSLIKSWFWQIDPKKILCLVRLSLKSSIHKYHVLPQIFEIELNLITGAIVSEVNLQPTDGNCSLFCLTTVEQFFCKLKIWHLVWHEKQNNTKL